MGGARQPQPGHTVSGPLAADPAALPFRAGRQMTWGEAGPHPGGAYEMYSQKAAKILEKNSGLSWKGSVKKFADTLWAIGPHEWGLA